MVIYNGIKVLKEYAQFRLKNDNLNTLYRYVYSTRKIRLFLSYSIGFSLAFCIVAIEPKYYVLLTKLLDVYLTLK